MFSTRRPIWWFVRTFFNLIFKVFLFLKICFFPVSTSSKTSLLYKHFEVFIVIISDLLWIIYHWTYCHKKKIFLLVKIWWIIGIYRLHSVFNKAAYLMADYDFFYTETINVVSNNNMNDMSFIMIHCKCILKKWKAYRKWKVIGIYRLHCVLKKKAYLMADYDFFYTETINVMSNNNMNDISFIMIRCKYILKKWKAYRKWKVIGIYRLHCVLKEKRPIWWLIMTSFKRKQ